MVLSAKEHLGLFGVFSSIGVGEMREVEPSCGRERSGGSHDRPRPFVLQGDTLTIGDPKTWKRALQRVRQGG